jgi:hypothetical protein
VRCWQRANKAHRQGSTLEIFTLLLLNLDKITVKIPFTDVIDYYYV